MYTMYVVLPASISFQEGSMNHEVEQQQDLTKILGDFKAMQDLHKTQAQVLAIQEKLKIY